MNSIPALCEFPSAKFLIFSENVPALVYYSHLPALVIALFLGYFVFIRNKNALENKIFFFTMCVFALWVFFSLITWSWNRSDVLMFFWSLIILIEPLIHLGFLYLLKITYDERDVQLKTKIAWLIIYLPLIIITPTRYHLSGFNLSSCFPVEHLFSHYSYFLEILIIFLIIFLFIRRIKSQEFDRRKKQVILFSVGIVIFLSLFTLGNLTGSITGNWNIAQVALFGFHFFVGFLTYLIVKFKIFNIKVLAAQALVFTLSLTVLSLMLLRHLFLFQRLTIFFTFLFCLILGYFFIRSIKKEVKLNEQLVLQAEELRLANHLLKKSDELKSEFASLATHHILTPLTSIKGYVSLLEEKKDQSEFDSILVTLNRLTNQLVNIVRDFLDVSRIEVGEIKYDFRPMCLNDLLLNITEEYQIAARRRNIKFKYVCRGNNYTILGDRDKLQHAFINMLESSLKYTPTGFIEIKMCYAGNKIKIKIADSSVRNLAILPKRIYQKLVDTGNAEEACVVGNGLGLYVAKQYIEAHKGSFSIRFREKVGVDISIEFPIEPVVSLNDTFSGSSSLIQNH